MTAIVSVEPLETALTVALADAQGRAGRPARSVGVDVVEIPVLARTLEKAGKRFATRVYTAAERKFCGGDAERLASTMAGKEAVAKALGTGVRGGVRWTDIQILREPNGRPYARLGGVAAERAALRFADIAISLGHEGHVAFAVAIGIQKEVERDR